MNCWSHSKAGLVNVAVQWSQGAKTRAKDCCRPGVSDPVVFFLVDMWLERNFTETFVLT